MARQGFGHLLQYGGTVVLVDHLEPKVLVSLIIFGSITGHRHASRAVGCSHRLAVLDLNRINIIRGRIHQPAVAQLALPQSHFDPLAVSYERYDPQDGQFALEVDQAGVDDRLDPFTVLGDQGVFIRRDFFPLHMAPEVLFYERTLFGRYQGGKVKTGIIEFIRPVFHDMAAKPVGEDHPAHFIYEDHVGRLFGQVAEFLLRSPERRLYLLPFGDVLDRAEDIKRSAGHILRQACRNVHPDKAPVLADILLVQHILFDLPLQQTLQQPSVIVEIIGMGDLQKVLRKQFFLRITNDTGHLGVDLQETSVEIGDDAAQRRLIERKTQPLGVLPQGRLGLPAFGQNDRQEQPGH